VIALIPKLELAREMLTRTCTDAWVAWAKRAALQLRPLLDAAAHLVAELDALQVGIMRLTTLSKRPHAIRVRSRCR
jgi:hypothetical protein